MHAVSEVGSVVEAGVGLGGEVGGSLSHWQGGLGSRHVGVEGGWNSGVGATTF